MAIYEAKHKEKEKLKNTSYLEKSFILQGQGKNMLYV